MIQLSLFNEAEKFSDLNAEEPTLEEITYKRAKVYCYTFAHNGHASYSLMPIKAIFLIFNSPRQTSFIS